MDQRCSGPIPLSLAALRERRRDDRDPDDVTKKKPEASAETDAANEVVWLAREQGLSLTGPVSCLSS